ncbi:hypothetical protein AYL99_08006 [Fonsecaea erecta]|uniref:Uncharacterized protein n=1 Tax=Fonsecaea erecta TaxID=1367422 RepID=A0A178ZBY0_9EURO|nr:hypothetical protein AYL99_08006 [Fonsecaea erecta]OAP57268.1 hypothetical protein AYL99_08006 [Fonsecaea erecta]
MSSHPSWLSAFLLGLLVAAGFVDATLSVADSPVAVAAAAAAAAENQIHFNATNPADESPTDKLNDRATNGVSSPALPPLTRFQTHPPFPKKSPECHCLTVVARSTSANTHNEGTCFWTAIDPSSYNQCAIITSHGGWASLGPDPGVKVDLYRDTACQQPFWTGLVYPGADDVPTQVAARGLPAVTGDVFGAVFRAP